MQPRNPYYENTDVRNRKKANEDILGTTQYSEFVSFLTRQAEAIEAETMYHVGFGMGYHFPVLKKLMPNVKLYGCEFDPMFLNFGQAQFQINDYVESLHLYGSMEEWNTPSTIYDVVFVEDWFYTLDRDQKAFVFNKMCKLTKGVMIFEKFDDDFDYDKSCYTVLKQVGDMVVIRSNILNSENFTLEVYEVTESEVKATTEPQPFLGPPMYEPSLESIYDGMGIPHNLRKEEDKEESNDENQGE
jgi:hypothetical protein